MKKVMHILQLKGIGGVQEIVYNLVLGLKQKGVDSYIFTFNGAEKSYIRMFKDEGFKIFVSPYYVNDIRNIGQICECLKSWSVDYLHVHNTIPHIFCSLILRFSKIVVKGIVTEHSHNSKRRKYRLFRFIDEFTYAPYYRIISVSQSVNNRMMNWLKHIDRHKFIIINNGVNIDRFINAKGIHRNSLGFKDSDFIIVSIGRLQPKKGFDTIIRALELLPDNYKLIIIGDGAQMGDLQKLSTLLGVMNRVSFVGNCRNVEDYLKIGNIYVSASHTEGFGLTIVEASAAGIPVIGTDIPVFREMIPITQLFPINDSRRLSEIIISKEYKQLKKLATSYSLESMINAYISVYNE